MDVILKQQPMNPNQPLKHKVTDNQLTGNSGELMCKKHSRILIGKDTCVDCTQECKPKPDLVDIGEGDVNEHTGNSGELPPEVERRFDELVEKYRREGWITKQYEFVKAQKHFLATEIERAVRNVKEEKINSSINKYESIRDVLSNVEFMHGVPVKAPESVIQKILNIITQVESKAHEEGKLEEKEFIFRKVSMLRQLYPKNIVEPYMKGVNDTVLKIWKILGAKQDNRGSWSLPQRTKGGEGE